MTSVKPEKSGGGRKRGVSADAALNSFAGHLIREYEARGGDPQDLWRKGAMSRGAYFSFMEKQTGIGLGSVAALATFFGIPNRAEFIRLADEWHADQLAQHPRTLQTKAGWDDACKILVATSAATEDELARLGRCVVGYISEPIDHRALRELLDVHRSLLK
jgi:hypothetical protein